MTLKKHLAILFAAGSLLLPACVTHEQDVPDETTNEDPYAFLRRDEEKPKINARESSEQEQVNPNDVTSDGLEHERIKTLEKTSEGKAVATNGIKKTSAFYEDFIIVDGDEELTVSLVFNSAPLIDVLPAFADILGFNFAADADLKGVVTLNLNSKMTKRELWDALDKILSLSGSTAVVMDSLVRVMPLSKLPRQSDVPLPGSPDAEVIYYPLKNVTAKDAVLQISAFLTPTAVAVELTRPNAVIVSDDRNNILKLRQILELIDKSGKTSWPRAVIKCQNIVPSQITDELRNVLPVLGFYVLQTTDKIEQPGSIQLSAVDRLQLIVAAAATEEAVDEIRRWVEILDSSESLDQERVFVYKVMHGKSDQLARALAAIYNLTGQSLTKDTETGANKIETLTGVTTTNTNNRTNANNPNAAANTETDTASGVYANPVKLFADGVLNRLVIRTTPRTYASIKALLDKLDIVPAQVLLQVMIVEVTLTESTQFGLEISGESQWWGENVGMGTDYSKLTPDFENPSSSGKGFNFLISDPKNPENKFAYIKALAGDDNVKIISRPEILVESHTQAYVNVGTKVPVLKQNLTNTGSSSSSGNEILQTVDYEDTGVILTVTPQVTSTNLISIEIDQQLLDAVYNTTSKIDSPEFTTRQFTTNMTIGNGQTMVIGGLIQEQRKDSLESIPIINNIPVLRRLVGSTDASAKRTEILLLVTGHIIDEKSRVEDMIKRYNDAVKSLNEFDYRLGDRPGAGRKMSVLDPDEFNGGLGRKK